VSQRYSTAAVDNRVLKADVETLRAKVNPCCKYILALRSNLFKRKPTLFC